MILSAVAFVTGILTLAGVTIALERWKARRERLSTYRALERLRDLGTGSSGWWKTDQEGDGSA